jgi:arabinofuranosyltransferase
LGLSEHRIRSSRIASSGETEPKRPALWTLGPGLALGLLVLAFSDISVWDDAYISFRYAQNLVSGEGLVFNPGEYVEGYTNLLWTLLMAIPEALGIPIHLAAVGTGLLFAVLALVEAWRICGLLGLPSWATATALAVLGAYPDFWLSSTLGLEGGLFAFLLALAVRFELSGKPGRAGLVGGLMFATRPESLLLLGIFGLHALLLSEDRRRRLVLLVGPWLALATAVTAWRLYYYGAWVPNSIIAKSPSEHDLSALLTNASMGTRYLAGFAWSASPLVLGATLGVIFAGRGRRLALWLCVGCVLAELPGVLANGGDWMWYHRLLAPFAPVLAVPLAAALVMVEGWYADAGSSSDVGSSDSRSAIRRRNAARRRRGVLHGVVVGSLAAILVVGTAFLPREQHVWRSAPDAEVGGPSSSCWAQLADAVKPALRSSDKVAIDVLGIFSYRIPDLYVYDLLGLTDSHVAREGYYVPRFGKVDPAYTYSREPALIITRPLENDLWLVTRMAEASGGSYERKYDTYVFDAGQVSENCPNGEFVTAIRTNAAGRILPTLSPYELQRVKVLLGKARRVEKEGSGG